MADERAQDGRGRDGLTAWAVAAVMIGTVILAGALPAARIGPPSTPTAFERDATCLEWTDACIVCTRGGTGVACSTPGIACERTAPRCLRRIGS